MTEDIYITDLGAPVLSELEHQVIASAKSVVFSEEAVLGAARTATGLLDFGAGDYRERLAVWLQSYDADKGLNTMGRTMAYDAMVRYAINRLRIEDLLKRQPEILRVNMERPIIIAGLPRSGTTHLVNVLAEHPDLSSTQLWEANEPVPKPDEMSFAADDSNPRYRRSNEVWHVMNNVLKYWSAMHEWAPDHVQEECELQCFDFASYMPEWQASVPTWQHYYLEHDQTPHYAYARKVMQIMSWLRGSVRDPNRWVMKSPPNMENLKAVFATYPDATVVITHRDPIAVLQSAITMMAYLDRLRRDQKDMNLPVLANYWIDRIETLLKRCVRNRDEVPQDQVIDVVFHDYMADQRGVIDKVFKRANLPITPEANLRLDAYLNNHPRGKLGRVIYDLKNNFGVDIGALRKRFQFYYDRFPVQQERVIGE